MPKKSKVESTEEVKMEELELEQEVIPEKKEYTIKVTHPSLRMRRSPNLQGEVVGYIRDQGYYKIVDEANGWGQLENGNWIMLNYTEIAY